jgi:hypothetical protein
MFSADAHFRSCLLAATLFLLLSLVEKSSFAGIQSA